MSYTVNTFNGLYRFTYEELLEIAEERILNRKEKNEIDKLFDIVCSYYGVPKSLVLSSSRKQELVEEQSTKAKAYQQSIQSNVDGLYNDYYVALENGYTPNISKYISQDANIFKFPNSNARSVRLS